MICSICLNSLKKTRSLPCRHKFHPKCIERWIEINNSCPICRKPIEDNDVEIFIKNVVFDFYTILLLTVIQLLNTQFKFSNFLFALSLNCILISVRNIYFIYCT